MKIQKIEGLFRTYERALDQLNIEAVAALYDDRFISAGPKRSIVQTRNHLKSEAKKAGEIYKKMGQTRAKILSKKITEISNDYAIVTVHWGITFQKTGPKPVQFDVSYLIRQIGDDTKVILLISHDDQEETMKNKGLMPVAANKKKSIAAIT
jgi:hypothetical protein